MATESKVLDPEQVSNPDVSYEQRDLSHRAVFMFFALLAAGGIVLFFALFGIFRGLGESDYAGHQTTNPIMTSNEELQPIGGDPALSFPMPRLQPDPTADLNKFRIREEERLNSYGWVDAQGGRIHMPIERAIDVLANSWPANQQQSAGAAQAGTVPNARAQGGNAQANKEIRDERQGNYGW